MGGLLAASRPPPHDTRWPARNPGGRRTAPTPAHLVASFSPAGSWWPSGSPRNRSRAGRVPARSGRIIVRGSSVRSSPRDSGRRPEAGSSVSAEAAAGPGIGLAPSSQPCPYTRPRAKTCAHASGPFAARRTGDTSSTAGDNSRRPGAAVRGARHAIRSATGAAGCRYHVASGTELCRSFPSASRLVPRTRAPR
jgi:hypothetical protein